MLSDNKSYLMFSNGLLWGSTIQAFVIPSIVLSQKILFSITAIIFSYISYRLLKKNAIQKSN